MAVAADFASIPLFRHVGEDTLKRVADVAREAVFPEGFEVVTQGDDGLGFFLITEGEFEVIRDGVTLARLGPGEYFGEMSLLDDEPRSATVRSATEGRCHTIYRFDFLTLVRRDPDLSLALLEDLSRRLRALDEQYAAER
jgi:CRP/FNR family cyclic AMP-dependent transcriptional regulator